MSYDFNADEVFEMAVQMEKNGAKFYRDAAEKIEDPDNKKLLLDLAAMEDAHEKTFSAMKAEITDKEKSSTVFDPDAEAALYLRALVNSRVFYKKEIDPTSMVEIFKAAIDAEKDAIVFYLGMKEWVPPAMGKNRLDFIIKEEMSHIKLLSGKLMTAQKAA
ncbi:MAG: ferritin family protein [Desulfobacterales bacterium]|nr:ferritin family protein [Desulfobacterales bacterium]